MLKDLTDQQIRAGVGKLIEQGKVSETELLYAILAAGGGGSAVHIQFTPGNVVDHAVVKRATSGSGGGLPIGIPSQRKPAPAPAPAPASRPAPAANPQTAASRKLQGRYLALIRRFPKTKRAKFSKIAKTDGREAAIRAMERDS
jgi:hypothetical protein